MKTNSILQKLQKIYMSLSVKFPYTKIPWDDIFSIPDADKLVNEFILQAQKVDIQVEVIEDINALKRRIEDIFANYIKIWLEPSLKSSPLFKDRPVVDNQWEAQAGISTCKALIARTGSIIIDSKQGRQTGLIASHHFVIASKKQIYPDLSHFFEEMVQNEELPSSISIITGPSRTADIEKKLVKGAHGPASITVQLLI